MHAIFASFRLAASSLAAGLLVCNVISPVSAQNNASTYTFTTFVGFPATGSADGIGTAALFANPYGVAVDGAGNIFVADSGNKTIRRITPAGVVTTIAGLAGFAGSVDGTNNGARFGEPRGIVVDSVGNLYVVDRVSRKIRKVTSVGTNWVVTTIAGSEFEGTADGTNGAASFFRPSQIALDAGGTLYVTDEGHHTIRMISPMGTNWVTTTIAGSADAFGNTDGEGSEARFNEPYGIAVDSSTNVYVAEGSNPTIRKITPTGSNWIVSTIAGQAGSYGTADGTNSAARFSDLLGLTIDSTGILYACDGAPRTIRKITPIGTDWIVSTLAGRSMPGGNDGTGLDGTGTNALFGRPAGIAADTAGNLYVADTGNSTIRQITSAAVVTTVAGSASATSANGTRSTARFNHPSGVALDSVGNIYVADEVNCTIRKITSAGVVSTLAGRPGVRGWADGAGDNARFRAPLGIAVDGAGNVYVADSENFAIRRVSPAGFVTTLAGSAVGSDCVDGTNNGARFSTPADIAVDGATNLFVADAGCSTVRKISPVGTNWVVTTVAGFSGIPGGADGEGTNARFNSPDGIDMDSSANLYITDRRAIRKVVRDETNWVVSTIAGLAGAFGSTDGTNNTARFGDLAGITLDGAGNLYVTDLNRNSVRKVQPIGTNWIVSTLGGLPGVSGSVDGVGNDARFNQPKGIVADSAGTIYVADNLNNTIRQGVFTAYGSASMVPYVAPPMNGRLTVTLLPPEAHGQWRFPWELSWHDSGFTASNLVAGNYPVEFRNVPGWLAIPLSDPLPLTAGGAVSITREYYPTLSPENANSAAGTLTVNLGITPPPGAGWRFLGETTPYLATSFTTNLLPGTYLIEFAEVNGRVKPPSQAVQVNAGQPSYLSVSYLLAAAPPANVQLPFPVPAHLVGDETTYPFGFNGQLQSDIGYGSGVAVSTNVVLTAAHLVFNDQTLSYVSHAYWFFRRDAGVSEPLPLETRGFYVLSGYAAQRTNDLASGYSPDQSTPPSRNMDVAALYFLQRVAGGGHGGYLPSDAVPNTWLTSTALKMLVGYPVDGSQFGTNVVPGKMYQTDPQPYSLSLATDAVPGQQQQVYEAPWFLSYPGNSGGPLYVQLNGYYYPAAVYLGTRFSGSQPVSSLVRAIDSNVVNLITLAASQGDSGTNFTGGGVITIIPSQNINAKNPGYVQFQLAPPAAVRAGAAWRLRGGVTTNYCGGNLICNMLFVTSTNSVVVEFFPLLGWNLPPDQTISVARGQLMGYTSYYSVSNPVLFQNRAGGTNKLGMTGTTGTVYWLERKSALTDASWLEVSTNTIRTNGFNPVLTNPAPGFYRLNWVTNF